MESSTSYMASDASGILNFNILILMNLHLLVVDCTILENLNHNLRPWEGAWKNNEEQSRNTTMQISKYVWSYQIEQEIHRRDQYFLSP